MALGGGIKLSGMFLSGPAASRGSAGPITATPTDATVALSTSTAVAVGVIPTCAGPVLSPTNAGAPPGTATVDESVRPIETGQLHARPHALRVGPVTPVPVTSTVRVQGPGCVIPVRERTVTPAMTSVLRWLTGATIGTISGTL